MMLLKNIGFSFLLFIFGLHAAFAANDPAIVDLSATEKTTLSRLADVLDDAKLREVLIEQLRSLANSDEKNTNQAAKKSSENQKASSDQTSKKTTSSGPSAADLMKASVTGVLPSKNASTSSDEKSDTTTEDESNKPPANDDLPNVIVQAANDIPHKLAKKTLDLGDEVTTSLHNSWKSIVAVVKGENFMLNSFNTGNFLRAFWHVAAILLFAFVVFQGIRALLIPPKKRLNQWSISGEFSTPLVRKLISLGVIAILSSLTLGITYLLANGLVIVFKDWGFTSQATLLINAFTTIELLKIVERCLWYPRYSGIRLIPVDDKIASAWYLRETTIINILGYGYLVITPVVTDYLGSNIGQVVSTVISLTVFIIGAYGVFKYHPSVKAKMLEWAAKESNGVRKLFLNTVAYTWHWFSYAYFLMLLIVTVLHSGNALPFVLKGTLMTIALGIITVVISELMLYLIDYRVHLSEKFQRNFPGAQARLNLYLPLIAKVLLLVLSIAEILILLSIWEIIDLSDWIKSTQGKQLIGTWSSVFWILILALAFWIIATAIIENKLSPDTGEGKPSPRIITILFLIKNALAVLLVGCCVMLGLKQIGINIAPLIAGAGVIGLAVGFGAQTLVKDVITGIFIQLENAINTGDSVTVCGITGTAENISIRSVSLRDIEGTYHIIPFSSVTTVSNFNRGFAYHKGVYGISYNNDIDYACEKLQEAFQELIKGDLRSHILEQMTINGVTELGDNSVNIRILIKTTPGDQFSVGRAYNRLVKYHFDKAGIEFPFPQTTITFGQNNDASSVPVNIRMMQGKFDNAGLPESAVVQQKLLEKEEQQRREKYPDGLQSKGDKQTNQGDSSDSN